MSLICVRCNKVIVLSTNPDHYGVCAGCGVNGMTDAEKAKIDANRPRVIRWRAFNKIGNFLAIEEYQGKEYIIACPAARDGSRGSDGEICQVEEEDTLFKDLMGLPDYTFTEEIHDWREQLFNLVKTGETQPKRPMGMSVPLAMKAAKEGEQTEFMGMKYPFKECARPKLRPSGYSCADCSVNAFCEAPDKQK